MFHEHNKDGGHTNLALRPWDEHEEHAHADKLCAGNFSDVAYSPQSAHTDLYMRVIYVGTSMIWNEPFKFSIVIFHFSI